MGEAHRTCSIHVWDFTNSQCVRADEQLHAIVNAGFAETQEEERLKHMQPPTSPRRHKIPELQPETIAEEVATSL